MRERERWGRVAGHVHHLHTIRQGLGVEAPKDAVVHHLHAAVRLQQAPQQPLVHDTLVLAQGTQRSEKQWPVRLDLARRAVQLQELLQQPLGGLSVAASHVQRAAGAFRVTIPAVAAVVMPHIHGERLRAR